MLSAVLVVELLPLWKLLSWPTVAPEDIKLKHRPISFSLLNLKKNLVSALDFGVAILF